MAIIIPLSPKLLEEIPNPGAHGDGSLSVLPCALMIHPRGFPSIGADIEPIYNRPTHGEISRHTISLGTLAYEHETGRLVRAMPRGLTEDDPHQGIVDLLAVYRKFGLGLDEGDARRINVLLIGLFLDLVWSREEAVFRPLLVPKPVP